MGAHVRTAQTRVCLASIRPPRDAAAALTSAWKRAGGRSSIWNAAVGAKGRRQLRLLSAPSTPPAAPRSRSRSAFARPVHPWDAGCVSTHSICGHRCRAWEHLSMMLFLEKIRAPLQFLGTPRNPCCLSMHS